MNFTLRQIEVFVAVAQRLHFGRAAEQLHITQASASQEVRRLELALGLTLFTRTTRTVAITPAGETILAASLALLGSANDIRELGRLLQEEYVHRLRVVVSPSVVNALLPRAISAAEAVLPDLQIEDLVVDSGKVSSAVEARRADIGVGRFLSAPAGYRHENLGDESLVVAVSASHPRARDGRVRLSTLHDLPLLLWARDQAPRYYDALLDICAKRGLQPLILVSPPLIVGSRFYLLQESRAFSLVPRSIVPFLPPGVVGVDLAEPATIPLETIQRINDPRTTASTFVKVLREVAASITAPSS